VDAGPRRPGQGHGPPQAVPQGRHAPLTRPVAAWDLAGWPRQRPIRGRVQGPGRGAGTAGEAVPDPTAPIPPGSSVPARSCLRSRGPCPNTFRAAAGNPAGGPSAPFHALETMVWEDGGMPDAVPPVDLAAWPRAGTIPGRGGGWTGRTCRPTWSGSAGVIASSRTATTRSRCWWWSSSGRGELTLDGQVHQLAPMVVAHLPKGTVRAIAAVDGPLAYLSVHRRRSGGLQVGRPAQ
jgi:hypothetical protein